MGFVEGTQYTTYIHTDDNERHDKRNCIHYRKKDNYCCLLHGKCCSGSHCPNYEYKRTAKPSTIHIEKTDPIVLAESFAGVVELKVSSINIPDYFRNPSSEEIKQVLKYYNEHGELDKPICVTVKSNKYFVSYNYSRLYCAKILHLDSIKAKFTDEHESRLLYAFQKPGTILFYKDETVTVVDCSQAITTIEFASGKRIRYHIETTAKLNTFLTRIEKNKSTMNSITL